MKTNMSFASINPSFKMQYNDNKSKEIVNNLKKEYADDKYVTDTINFADSWASRMEARMENTNKDFATFAYSSLKETYDDDKLIDFKLATTILSNFWKHGKEFSEWVKAPFLEVK